MSGLDRASLARLPDAYFEAVDAKELDATLAFFTPDATFTIQTAATTFTGHEEIASMFRGFFADFATIVHRVRNVVADVEALRVATEQVCPHVAIDGTPVTLTTCNVFEVAPDGRFRRVVVWIDGVSPLVGE
ncbi:MAG: nuclear transport factor 2 family protein [Gaiella sp.]